MCVNKDANTIQRHRRCCIPDPHQVRANTDNGQEDCCADPLHYMVDPRIEYHIIIHFTCSIALELCTIFQKAWCSSWRIGVKIASCNATAELDYIIVANYGAEKTVFLVQELRYHCWMEIFGPFQLYNYFFFWVVRFYRSCRFFRLTIRIFSLFVFRLFVFMLFIAHTVTVETGRARAVITTRH